MRPRPALAALTAALALAGCAPAPRPAPPGPTPPPVPLGQPARYDTLTFVAHGMRCGLRQVGPDTRYQRVRAVGRFCAVDFTVTNTGRQPAIWSSGWMYAYDARGRRYAPHGEATRAANTADGRVSPVVETLLNPGIGTRGWVVFDTPAGTVLAEAEFGDGVTPGIRARLTTGTPQPAARGTRLPG